MKEKLIEHFGNFKCEEGYLTQEDFDKRNKKRVGKRQYQNAKSVICTV